jgi:hypothetical protein
MFVGCWTAIEPKEVPEESVPERDRRNVIPTNVALVAVEQSEMVVVGIPEASAAAEVLYEVVRPLPLGGEVAACQPWSWAVF